MVWFVPTTIETPIVEKCRALSDNKTNCKTSQIHHSIIRNEFLTRNPHIVRCEQDLVKCHTYQHELLHHMYYTKTSNSSNRLKKCNGIKNPHVETDYALQMLKAHGDTTFHEEHLTLTLTLTEVHPTIVRSLT